MRLSRSFLSFTVGILLGLPIGTSYAAPPATLPSVTVTGVTATSPVLRSTSNIAVSATVTSTFDINSSTTPSPDYSSCNIGNNFCGTGDSTIKSKKVVTTTDVTVTNKTTTVAASDFNSSDSGSLSGTAYSATLATPTSGTDGFTTVTVSANVSETVTTCVTTATSYWTGANGSGSQVGSTTTVGPTCDGGVNKPPTGSNSGSNTGSYVLDINAPILTLHPVTSQPTVLQGEDKNIHNELIGGSSATTYTLTDTIYGPSGYTNSANGGDTFGPGADGIAPKENDLVGVHVACDAPIGDYYASAVANTVDLGLNPFAQISSVDVAGPGGPNSGGSAQDTFSVGPGLLLEDQTQVVSELPPSGDYAPMTCFTANQGNRKVNTFPGSLHITSVVNTTGPCAGFGTISGTVVTLTLPAGFSFDTTGASPPAHVFIFPAATGFDFHYPGAETSLPKAALVKSGQTLTVDLSSVGAIPSSDTIYVRAHAVFSDTTVPADGTQYVFGTSTTSQLPGIGVNTNSSTQTVTKNNATCVNGN
jgi:hypothetical protein